MTDPADHLYLIEHQVWARVDSDGLITQGITALGVRLSGEVYMCRPKGAGVQVVEVNQLMKQFEQMQKLMKMMKGGNQKKLMRQMEQMRGRGGMPGF